MLRKQEIYNVACYCRLSQEDDNQKDESLSIETQKSMIKQYCDQHGLNIAKTYVDDGFSGANFTRPSFQRMIQDINNDKINCVIVKDLSRFGRNDIYVGIYIEEFFKEKNVRFIAINDQIDTLNNVDFFSLKIRNMMNAYFVQDISMKTKSAKITRAKEGKYLGSQAPFGYVKDPLDKNHLIIDEEASNIVKYIFNRYIEGAGLPKIRDELTEKNIMNPTSHFNRNNPNYVNPNKWRGKCHWHLTSIRNILTNRTYYGAVVYHKTEITTVSGTKSRKLPESEWIIVEKMHEPIISKEQWETCQRILKSRQHPTRSGRINIFKGLVKCSDCGSTMSLNSTSQGRFKSFGCWNYKVNGKQACTSHSIGYKTLYHLVLNDIQKNALIAKIAEKKLIGIISQKDKEEQNKLICSYEKKISRNEKRIIELDQVLTKIYEDYALNKMSEQRYYDFEKRFTEERQIKFDEIVDLKQKKLDLEKERDNAKKYVDMIKTYINIKELNAIILNTLIDKIVVHEKETIDNKKYQQVDIHYRFVDVIDSEEIINQL